MNGIRLWIKGVREAIGEDAVLRSVLKNTGWLTGSSGVVILLSTIQGVLAARLLGVAVWGVLAVAVGFVSVAGRLLSFRMSDFVVKWVTQLHEQDRALAPTAFKLALAGEIVTALLAFVIAEALAAWGAAAFAKSPEMAWVFRVLAVTVLLQAGSESFTGMMQVSRDFRIQGIIQAVGQAASALGVLIVFLARGALPEVVGVLLAVQALKAALNWGYGIRAAGLALGTGWVRAPLEHLGDLGREMARFAIMVNISQSLKSTLSDGDLLILGFLTSPAQVAYYKLARSICQIAQMPMMPMVNASYPEFGSAAARNDWGVFRRLMRRGSEASALWVVPVSVGLVALSPWAIEVLYGRSFVPAVPALALLLVGVCIDAALYWTRVALLSTGQPGYDTTVNLVGTIAKVALAFIIVPVGGYIAMAGLSSLVLTGQNLICARRVYATVRARESAAPA